MAALNQRETQDLRDLLGLLNTIQRRGYTPPPDSTVEAIAAMPPDDRTIGNALNLYRRRVHTLIQRKGYYPS